MRTILTMTAAAALPLALGGCETTSEPMNGPVVTMIHAGGLSVGTVRLWETPGGVGMRILASGLPHGNHGLHVHAVGRCDTPGFESAGPHWNPTAGKHGFNNPAGPHRGDLPNVTVAANGTLSESVSLPGASLATLLDADGAALVLHAAPDDYVSDPSGNSGGRIACAVLTNVVPARR